MISKFTKVIKSKTTDEIFGYMTETGKAKYNPIYRDIYGLDLPFICDVDNTIWMPVKETCQNMGLSPGQIGAILKRCKEDPYLKLVTSKMSVGRQNNSNKIIYKQAICIKEESFIMFLVKLDHLSLTDKAYNTSKYIINKAFGFPLLKESKEDYFTNGFHKEKILQEKLFNTKKILDIDILEKEKIYDFGRIDLYGIDSNGNRVCIELKLNEEFSDTKEQLLRYKNSKEFDRILYVANKISDDFKKFLEENKIEFLQYEINPNSHIVELN